MPQRPAKSQRAEVDDPRFRALLAKLADEPRFAPVLKAFAATQQQRKGFGSNGLAVNRKLFALISRGRLVVKLPRERVDALVASRKALRFDPRHGRKMKEWAVITDTRASWRDLVAEAHDFVEKPQDSR